VNTPDDVRDGPIGDALGTAAGTDEPNYDRVLERVRTRGRIRRTGRWTAVVTAVAVFVGAVTWAGLSIAAHDRSTPVASRSPSTGSTPTGWHRVAVPGTGMTMRVPADWHTQKIAGDCMLDPRGLFVGNLPGPYGTIATSDGCRWPPGMGRLPSTAVVVGIDHYEGGPPPAPVEPGPVPTGSPFPLSLSRFDHVRGTLRTTYGSGFAIAGDGRYQVFAWIGNDATAADRAVAGRIVASIAPAPCPPPTPVAYEPSLSPSSSTTHTAFTVSGEVPTTLEDGMVTEPSGSIAVFWNVDPDAPEAALTGGRLDDLLAGRTPAPGPDGIRFLGVVNVAGACHYDMMFVVPDVPPGTYDLAVFEVGGGGAALLGPPLPFTITG
jgi:hypothetical protein